MDTFVRHQAIIWTTDGYCPREQIFVKFES